MLTLYKSMVRSLVEYCCPLWHPSKISDIQELESVQKTFISRITGMKELHYYDQLIHLPSCPCKEEENASFFCTCGRSCMGRPAMTLTSQFVSRPRLGTLAIIPSKSRTSSAANQTLFDNSFAVQGPKLWNAMPHNLNNIQSLEHFKDQLTKFLLSFPDMPQIRGCSPPNSNSLLSWRIERGYTSLWGGRNC